MTLSKAAYKRAFFKAAVITAFLVPFIWSPLNRFLLNAVLFAPFPYPFGNYNSKVIGGIPREDIFFKSENGCKLHGWYFNNPKSKYTMLVSHGMSGNVSINTELPALLIKSGASVMLYDYEGFGRSEGFSSVENACGDARSAYKFLVEEKKVAPEKIVLCGESFGSGITSNLSQTARSAGIILQSPFVSLRQRAVEIFPVEAIYPQSFYPENALDTTAIMSKTHAPLLVICGVLDNVTPVWHADKLAKVASEPKTYVRIEGVAHSGDPRLLNAPQYLEGVKSFLSSLENKRSIPGAMSTSAAQISMR